MNRTAQILFIFNKRKRFDIIYLTDDEGNFLTDDEGNFIIIEVNLLTDNDGNYLTDDDGNILYTTV